MPLPNKPASVLAEEAEVVKGKNMIALTSGTRGCGKTWFAVNLSQALSMFKQKVLLFDGDSGLSNTKVQLGLDEANDLNAVIFGNRSLNQIVYDYDKGRFSIITSNSGSSGLSMMSIGRLQILGDDLSIIAQNYDKVILDMRAGISDASKVLAGMSQNIMVICTDTPQSMTESYGLIKILASRYPKINISIVINQVNSISTGLRTYEIMERACREFLPVVPKLLGIVRQDTRVRDSIRNQSTIINRYPNSEASQDILAIAQRILSHE